MLMFIKRVTAMLAALSAAVCLLQPLVVIAALDNPDSTIIGTSNGNGVDEPDIDYATDGTTDDYGGDEADGDYATPGTTCDDENKDIVYSWDKFREWMSAHSKTGGAVYLGKDIEADGGKIYRFLPDAPVVVNTGRFGLKINYLEINENVSFIGEGVENPVLSTGGAEWYGGSVTATGRNSEGGTALYIDGHALIAVDYTKKAIRIESRGEGAVGVEIGAHGWDIFTVTSVIIETDGKNSVCVTGANQLELRFCFMRATGDGAETIDKPTENVTALMSNIGGAEGITRYGYKGTILHPAKTALWSRPP